MCHPEPAKTLGAGSLIRGRRHSAITKTSRRLYTVHGLLAAVVGTGGSFSRIREQRGRETMNNLDRFMELVVAAVFTLVGLSKIFSYKYKAAGIDGSASELAIEFPYWCVALVGLFEML